MGDMKKKAYSIYYVPRGRLKWLTGPRWRQSLIHDSSASVTEYTRALFGFEFLLFVTLNSLGHITKFSSLNISLCVILVKILLFQTFDYIYKGSMLFFRCFCLVVALNNLGRITKTSSLKTFHCVYF